MTKFAKITAMLAALTAAVMPTASSAYEVIAHRAVYQRPMMHGSPDLVRRPSGR